MILHLDLNIGCPKNIPVSLKKSSIYKNCMTVGTTFLVIKNLMSCYAVSKFEVGRFYGTGTFFLGHSIIEYSQV